ncbi:NADPH dependent preQ0 reductase [hydrothermal vent metagenome]|uniref:NADPH dependent preQ0 reductase n=1 Tax=hydrothermal vent metagenome TaxID=652676 RepID=A0A1W1D394_9ZZZZ
MKYGEKEIREFDVTKDLELWPNKHEKDYLIKVTLPEFMAHCPRSGYPDFAEIYIEYIPDKYVVELKALKLYINSFMYRYISHEDAANEIYDVIKNAINPRYIKLIADFKPRGNVHTVIEIDSSKE